MQAAIIANANNINEQAFSFNDYIQFMGGLSNAISNNNGLLNFDEFGKDQAPKGLTDNFSTGINFNYDFSPKFNLKSHYFVLNSNNKLEQETLSQEFTDEESFQTDKSINQKVENQNHRVQLKLNFKPSPFVQWKWINNLNIIDNQKQRLGSTNFFTNNQFVGFTSANTDQENDQEGIDGKLILRKKYQKIGRNWINTLEYQIGSFEEIQNIENSFDLDQSLEVINQFQKFNFENRKAVIQSVFTESLNKSTYLSATYSFEVEREAPRKEFFDIEMFGNLLNEELSGLYTKTNNIHKTRLSLKKNSKKLKFNASLANQWSTINGEGSTIEIPIVREDFYFLPSFSLEKPLSSISKIKINYSTKVNLPTLNQLAPLPNNSNPNILFKGNPDLKPAYQHRVQLRYELLDLFNFTNLFITTFLEKTNNWITNQIQIDDQFLQTYRPVNIDDHLRVYGNVSFNAPIKPLKLKFRMNANYSYSTYESFLNTIKSPVQEQFIRGNLVIENREKETWDISVGIQVDYNSRDFLLQQNFIQQFITCLLYTSPSPRDRG